MTITVNKVPEQVSDRYDFLGEWMKVAEDRNLFFRFFCCFLSFNHLYSKDNHLHADENDDSHDMPVITRFLVRTFAQARDNGCPVYQFPKDFDFKKCTLQKHVRVLAEPELRWVDTEPYIQTALANEGVVRNSDEWNLIKIFLRIYKIRCNLFHGAKSPANADDVARVGDSCVILESFLRWYVTCGLNEVCASSKPLAAFVARVGPVAFGRFCKDRSRFASNGQLRKVARLNPHLHHPSQTASCLAADVRPVADECRLRRMAPSVVGEAA